MEWIGDLERAFAAAIYPNRYLLAIVAVGGLVALVLVARRRRWDLTVRRHPRGAIAAAAVSLAIGIPLACYLGSPLFISTTVDEPAPIAAAVPPSPAFSSRPVTSAQPAPSPSKPGATNRPATPTPAPTPVALIERSGSFRGADDFHFGKGTARLIETSPGSFTVRLEDFAVRNGPDLYVYLSPSADGYAKGAIELGRLKADRGNQNYAVPPNADAAESASVVIWCRQFSVQFATARLR